MNPLPRIVAFTHSKVYFNMWTHMLPAIALVLLLPNWWTFGIVCSIGWVKDVWLDRRYGVPTPPWADVLWAAAFYMLGALLAAVRCGWFR